MTAQDIFYAELKQRRSAMGPGNRAKSRVPNFKGVTWLYPQSVESSYAKWAGGVQKRFSEIYIPEVEENYQRWLRDSKRDSSIRVDAFGPEWANTIDQLRREQQLLFENKANRDSLTSAIFSFGNEANEFNQKQFDKFIKIALGHGFDLNEPWVEETLDNWSEENLELIRSLSDENIKKVNTIVRDGIQNGTSYNEIMKSVRALDDNMSKTRSKLIARDQVGKLNGLLTKGRQEDLGIDTYFWSTVGDERVRGRNGEIPSHVAMDGKLCRWDNPTVYSDDGGETWKPRTGKMPMVHPGMAIQCRCSAIPNMEPIFNEVDEDIGDSPEKIEEQTPNPAPPKKAPKSPEQIAIEDTRVSYVEDPKWKFIASVRDSKDTKKVRQMWQGSISRYNKENQAYFDIANKTESISRLKKGKGYYQPGSKEIAMKHSTPKTEEAKLTWRHEAGHALDYQLGEIKRYDDANDFAKNEEAELWSDKTGISKGRYQTYLNRGQASITGITEGVSEQDYRKRGFSVRKEYRDAVFSDRDLINPSPQLKASNASKAIEQNKSFADFQTNKKQEDWILKAKKPWVDMGIDPNEVIKEFGPSFGLKDSWNDADSARVLHDLGSHFQNNDYTGFWNKLKKERKGQTDFLMGLSDSHGAATRNRVGGLNNGIGGHSTKYFFPIQNGPTEIFANMTEAALAPQSVSHGLIKYSMPNTFKIQDDAIKAWAKVL